MGRHKNTAYKSARIPVTKGPITEEPCAGKLARTVLKQRWEERFSHRL